VCGGLYSWNDIVSTLNEQGHTFQVIQVPPEAYDNFFPGADEMRVMFQYWEQYTYVDPESEKRIAAANALVPGGFTGFAGWAKLNWKVNQEA
jgi:hypothetical protein